MEITRNNGATVMPLPGNPLFMCAGCYVTVEPYVVLYVYSMLLLLGAKGLATKLKFLVTHYI